MAFARTVFTATVALAAWAVVSTGCGSSSSGGGPSNTPSDGGTTTGEGSTGPLACTPGKQDSCACPGSTVTGAQTCNADGHGYGPCTGCPSPDGGGTTTGTDAGRTDGGSDSGRSDGGQGEGGGPAPGTYDGTTGSPCTTDADCVSVGGPHVNRCSTSLGYNAGTGATLQPFPTPVCVLPPGPSGTNCDPAPASDPTGQFIHFCDGPDDSSSPGICVPATNPPSSGRGTCQPQCVFTLDGSSASGCLGNDTCVQIAIAVTQGGQLLGQGYCQGTCETDSDCATLGSSFVCQTDTGYCTTHRVTRSKAIGAACTANDLVNGACNCLITSSTTGYCTSACIVGGTPCQNGWTCETFQPAAVSLGGGSIFVIPAENQGLAGMCAPPCDPADAGGGACPPNSACQSSTVGGPDCLP